MIEQSKIHSKSKQLRNYLQNTNNVVFENHGYDEASKSYSKKTIKYQNDFSGNDIWLDTTIGQPFLYVNEKNELDIAGVLDYNPISQTGTFFWNTIQGELSIDNVHSYFVFFNMEFDYRKYMTSYSKYLPEYEEARDILVALITKKSNIYSLFLYQNTSLILAVDNVYPELYFKYHENATFEKRLQYFRYSVPLEKNRFENYIYDIKSKQLKKMDNSELIPSFYINYKELLFSNLGQFCKVKKSSSISFSEYEKRVLEQNVSLYELDDNDKDQISIIIHLDNSQTAAVIKEFIKKADDCMVLENFFIDDDTQNIKVTYINKPKDVRFLYYCLIVNPEIMGFAIYNQPISNYLMGTKNYEKEYKILLTHENSEIVYYKTVVKEFYEFCDEAMKINTLPQKMIDYYNCNMAMINGLHKYCYEYDVFYNSENEYKIPEQSFMIKNKNRIFEKEILQYNDIYQRLAKKNNLPIKWKNEYTLYRLLLKEFPDAIYQYHSSWLGKQSLDIYIPSLRLGFEYQGEQHYKPIEFFGGEKSFKYRLELDNKKRTLCTNNNVKLIEWKYTEPITKKRLLDYIQIK